MNHFADLNISHFQPKLKVYGRPYPVRFASKSLKSRPITLRALPFPEVLLFKQETPALLPFQVLKYRSRTPSMR